MEIRIKPELVFFANGFDAIGRPLDRDSVATKINLLINSYEIGKMGGGKIVYSLQKFRQKKILKQEFTKTGKLKKVQPDPVLVPTHWAARAYFIPGDIVKLLNRNGKKIVQHARYWEIIAK
jgi:hypothetical protein